MGTKLDPVTKKITLVEIDLKQGQSQWFNWCAGVWYVDFDNVYERIDAAFLAGMAAQFIIMVGSVIANGAALAQVATVALCESTNASFFYDTAGRRLYVHLNNGDEPAIEFVRIGVTIGLSNHAGYYNSIYYEPRIKSPPSVTKTKDPLFFGRISLDSGSLSLDNTDGAFDAIGENASALFGAEARILQGLDTDAYGAFVRLATRMVENVRVSRDSAEFDLADKRKGLSRSVPLNVFDSVTYPDLDSSDIGKPIPLAYGLVYQTPVVCTNKNEGGPPAQYHFKLADTAGAGHNIKSVVYVYVNGVSVAFTNVNLATATLDVASGVYAPGDEVWVTFTGFETGGAMIENPADVILDLLNTWLGITYIAANFNLAEWAATTAAVTAMFPDAIGLFIDSPTEIYAILQDICASFLLNMIPQDDGKFTLRMYDAARAVSQSFDASDLLEVPSYEYDTSQLISYTSVEYARTWHNGNPRRLMDTSQDAAIFAIYGKHVLGTFATLLTTEADAQTFSTAMLSIQGAALRKFSVRFKLQPFDREIMDFIDVYIWRPTKAMIGKVKAEVLSKQIAASSGVVLGCRIVFNYP